jgi:hypothetical protein
MSKHISIISDNVVRSEENNPGHFLLYNIFVSLLYPEVSGKFWNVVLEKNGEDQLDRSCEKWRSITQS